MNKNNKTTIQINIIAPNNGTEEAMAYSFLFSNPQSIDTIESKGSDSFLENKTCNTLSCFNTPWLSLHHHCLV